MRQRINVCHIYLLVILLCSLNGVLYEGGGILAQGLQLLLILMSLYYTFYANVKYKLPVYFKALNVLLIMFTIYGVSLVFSGEKLMVQASYYEVANTGYLKDIYKSLLPVYAFYVFTKQGLLKESTIKFWFFVWFFLAVRGFFILRALSLSESEEYTLNVGYTFVALMPALLLFQNKKIQYIGMLLSFYFTLMALKRGAIFICILCLAWFLVVSFKMVAKRQKWIVFVSSLVLIIAGIYLFIYLERTSTAFQFRMAQTQAGNTSGRDDLFTLFFDHFIHESDPVLFLFGNGASSTLKFGWNYAHNDWLEIAINQGLVGLLVYLAYWICFYKTWRKTRPNEQAFMAVGMIFIIYFLSTLFSMSYNSYHRCAAMVLGYFLANYNQVGEIKRFNRLS